MEPTLLPGEAVLHRFRPHPMSFLGAYLSAGLPALWAVVAAWLLRTPLWEDLPWDLAAGWSWLPVPPESAAAYVLLVGGVVSLGSIAAVARIKALLFIAQAGGAVAAVAVTHLWLGDDAKTATPILLVLLGIGLAGWTELDRLRHRYHVTSFRIIVSGGVLVTKERQVRYESITDLSVSQGLLGRWLDYGTIVPVTQSGFGLGGDSSQASAAAGRSGARGMFGASAGGGRNVQVARARTFNQLTGATPFSQIRPLLEERVHDGSHVTQLRALAHAGARHPGPAPAAHQGHGAQDAHAHGVPSVLHNGHTGPAPAARAPPATRPVPGGAGAHAPNGAYGAHSPSGASPAAATLHLPSTATPGGLVRVACPGCGTLGETAEPVPRPAFLDVTCGTCGRAVRVPLGRR